MNILRLGRIVLFGMAIACPVRAGDVATEDRMQVGPVLLVTRTIEKSSPHTQALGDYFNIYAKSGREVKIISAFLHELMPDEKISTDSTDAEALALARRKDLSPEETKRMNALSEWGKYSVRTVDSYIETYWGLGTQDQKEKIRKKIVDDLADNIAVVYHYVKPH